MEWNTTSTVLAKLHAGDEQSAWELFVGHFRDTLVRFAERMGLARADAQDAAQETLVAFVEGYRGGRYDRTRGRLKSWLFGIARRQVLALRQRHLADRRMRPAADSPPIEAVQATTDSGEDLWEEEWRRTVYGRSLERVREEVTPETFEVFRSIVFEQESTAEICRRFGIARTKVYNVKHRVSRRLAELIREYEDA